MVLIDLIALGFILGGIAEKYQKANQVLTRGSLSTVSQGGLSKFTSIILLCFFCDIEEGKRHRVSTIALDKRIRNCANEMSDTKLIAKLSEGDMVSRDAIYHKECLTGLHNRYRKFLKLKESPSNEKRLQSIAVAETAVYLEEQLQVNDKI